MKTNQIVLLIIVFVVCGLSGFFLGKVLKNVRIPSRREVVVSTPTPPTPVISTVPVIDTIIGPKSGAPGKYDFIVEASVESKDTLVYGLYSDEALYTKVAENTDGIFTGIPGIDSKIYYLVVKNKRTSDRTDLTLIDGFAKLAMFKKILESDLENLFNVTKSWTNAPKWMVDSVSPNIKIKVVNLNPELDSKVPKTMNDICMKMVNNLWLSVDVLNLGYDVQNRLVKLEIAVTYP